MTVSADTILCGDCLDVLKTLPNESVHCCVTSPPYYALRDYGMDAQIGREDTPEQYIARLTEVFREVRRVLRSDGTLWLNISDTYCGTGGKGDARDPKYPMGRNGQSVALNRAVHGCKQKDLIGIPWMLAFSLRTDGWYIRNDVIWEKANPMPESAKDRCTRCYEHVFLLTKSKKYYFTGWPSRSRFHRTRRRGRKRGAVSASIPSPSPDSRSRRTSTSRERRAFTPTRIFPPSAPSATCGISTPCRIRAATLRRSRPSWPKRASSRAVPWAA